MNYQNFINKLFIVGAVISTVFACTDSKTKLRLVFPNKMNYESLIIAHDQNFYNKTDSVISVKTVVGGTNAAEAFATGNADVIATGNGPAVILLAQDKDAVIIARYATGERMHHLLADTSITSLEGLKGKRIGIQSGSTTHAALLAWLKNNNIPVGDVSLIPMQPADMPEAMRNKQLDAIAGSQPWPINVEKICVNSVYELSDLYNPENCNPLVLTAKRDYYNSNKKLIHALLESLEKANQLLNNNPEESAQIVSKYTGIKPDLQQKATAEMQWEIGFNQNDIKSLEETAKTLYEMNLIKQIPDFAASYVGEMDK